MNDSEASAMRWLDGEIEEVRQTAVDALLIYAPSAAHHNLLSVIFLDAFDRLKICRIAASLSIVVAASVEGKISPSARKLSAGMALLEAGIYTLDHIMDREVEGPISELPPAVVLLAAVSLISHVPYQILLSEPDMGAAPLLATRLAEGLALIAAGQLADITADAQKGHDLSAVNNAVVMKTGERRALYAALAALQAGADEQQIEAYASYGRSLGIARQLRSDIQDLFGGNQSRDLASGTSTYPIMLLLEKATGPIGEEIRVLLARAKQDYEVHDHIRGHMRNFGILRNVLSLIESNCRDALTVIEKLRPNATAALLFRRLVREVSLTKA